MRNLSLFFALIIVALGAICIVQTRKLTAQQTQLASLRREQDQNEAQLEVAQGAQKAAEDQRAELLRQMEDLTARQRAEATAAASLKAAANPPPVAATEAKPEKEAAGFGKTLSKMMQDPEMKKLMRTQQRLVLDQLYSPLVKKLALTPEETDKFKNLLSDNMMAGAEQATSLFDDGASTNRTQMMAEIAAAHKKSDEQMKEFLGEARYADYKEYQETAGERLQLNQFRQQHAGGENAVSDQQVDQLLALMKEEKQNAAARGDPSYSGGQDQAGLKALLAEGETDKLIQSQQTVNQRVYDRARDLLSPAQLDSFGAFQTNQVQMMRMGMSMARKFLAPDKETTNEH